MRQLLNIFSNKQSETTSSQSYTEEELIEMAERMKEEVKHMIEAHGKKKVAVAHKYNDLGEIYLKLEKPDQALKYLEKSLSVYQRTWGEDHLYVSRIFKNIGSCYSSLEKYEKSIEMFQRALEITIKYKGTRSLAAGELYLEIGGLYHNLKKYQEALLALRSSLDIFEWNKNSLLYGRTCNSIGKVFYCLEDLDKAMEYYSCAMEIFGDDNEENAYDLAMIYNNVGTVFIVRKRYKEAEKFLNISLDITKKYFGDGHIELAKKYHNLGFLYKEQGKLVKALSVYQESLKLKMIDRKASSSEIGNTISGCGYLHFLNKDINRAKLSYQKSLQSYKKKNPSDEKRTKLTSKLVNKLAAKENQYALHLEGHELNQI